MCHEEEHGVGRGICAARLPKVPSPPCSPKGRGAGCPGCCAVRAVQARKATLGAVSRSRVPGGPRCAVNKEVHSQQAQNRSEQTQHGCAVRFPRDPSITPRDTSPGCLDRLQTPAGQCPTPARAQGMDGDLQNGKEPPKSNFGAQHLSHHPFPVTCSSLSTPANFPQGLRLCQVGWTDRQGRPYSH